MSGARTGVALSGHWLPLDAVARLVRQADALGYARIVVDGDTAVPPGRADAALYDGPTLAATLRPELRQAGLGWIRLPPFWNPVLTARELATAHDLCGSREVGYFGVGARPGVGRIGLPELGAADRIDWLDEHLQVLRALLRGERVTHRGRFLELDDVAAHRPATPVPIAVAAGGRRSMALVERHADVWDANVPPLADRIEPLRARLTRPVQVWTWIFARPGADAAAAAAGYRRACPWFTEPANARPIPNGDVEKAVLWGEPARCRDRLEELRQGLSIDLPIVDLAGLDEAGARHALEVLAPRLRE